MRLTVTIHVEADAAEAARRLRTLAERIESAPEMFRPGAPPVFLDPANPGKGRAQIEAEEEIKRYHCVYPQAGCNVAALPPEWQAEAFRISETIRQRPCPDNPYRGCCCGHSHRFLTETEQAALTQRVSWSRWKASIRNMTATETINDMASADMQAAVDAMNGPARGELSKELESILTGSAWRYAYVNARYGDGCGDQGHDYAVKCANRLLCKVRKALGYTYPERGAIRV